MISRLFNSQTKTITWAAGILAVSALISRVFGLIRNGLIAGHFGRGINADIYFAAFRVPDFVYNILIAGGVVVAFLPLFSEYYSKNKDRAWEMTSQVLNVFLFLLIAFCSALFLFTPALMKIIAPGFSQEAQKIAVNITRLMFLSPILFGLSSVFSGILHYFNRFLVYSLAPILYNLGIIFGIIFLAPKWGVFGVGIGVVIGALAHLLIQIPSAINAGFRFRPVFNLKHPALKRIFKLMLPRMFAMGSQQINLIVITAIASTIATGSIAIFTYADYLYNFPIGIVAIPFALAVFPSLTRLWNQGQKQEFAAQFSFGLRRILFFLIPFTVLIFLLRAQLVRLILGSMGPGSFDWLATQLTAACLALFCLGIWAQGLIPFLGRVFFSFQNTKTPTLITMFGVLLNIVLSFAFVRYLGSAGSGFLFKALKVSGLENAAVIGLPLAFSISVSFQCILLLIFLYKKIGSLLDPKKISKSILKMVAVSILSGAMIYLSLGFLAGIVNTHTVLGLLIQTILAGAVGIFAYLFLGAALKLDEAKAIQAAMFKVRL